jgi:hypothetical protein
MGLTLRRLHPRPHRPARARAFGELLIDPEEDKAARALVFWLLAKMEPR